MGPRSTVRVAAALAASLRLSFFSPVVHAQSMYDDGKGRTSLLMPSSNFVGMNTGDASIQLSLIRLRSNAPWVWGGRVKGKATDGTAKLFSGDSLSAGASADAYWGRKLDDHGNTILLVRGSLGQESITLYRSDQAFADQIKKDTYRPWEIGGNLTSVSGDFFIFGFAFGARRLNNYAGLKDVKLSDVTSQTNADGTVRNRTTEVLAKDGVYKEATSPFFDADILIRIPTYPLAARALGRFVFPSDSTLARQSLGLDLSVLKNYDPAYRIVGLTFAVDDPFKRADPTKKFSERLSLSLVANLPLSFFTP